MSAIVSSKAVREALEAGDPLVALESTVIAHGLPHPRNLDTALAMEEVVRRHGAQPATIGVDGGKAWIGMEPPQLVAIAQDDAVAKVSRRDLAAAVAGGGFGATTVSATMYLASLVGIRVMATGGLGGVHRGGESSLDVSADLEELARTPVAVVCAGAKAVLDLPRTLETLESRGVPVVGFRTSEFPAFYRRESGLPTSASVDSVEEAAALLKAQWELGLGGVLIVQPPPKEHDIPRARVERWIATALAEAEQRGIRGAPVTPFLLARINELSQGRSLETNEALLLENARLGARIANALAAT